MNCILLALLKIIWFILSVLFTLLMFVYTLMFDIVVLYVKSKPISSLEEPWYWFSMISQGHVTGSRSCYWVKVMLQGTVPFMSTQYLDRIIVTGKCPQGLNSWRCLRKEEICITNFGHFFMRVLKNTFDLKLYLIPMRCVSGCEYIKGQGNENIILWTSLVWQSNSETIWPWVVQQN